MLYGSKLKLERPSRTWKAIRFCRFLAEPAVHDHQWSKGRFSVGRRIPPPHGPARRNRLRTRVTIQLHEAGIHTYRQRRRGIQLTVAPEVSSLDYTNSVTISRFAVPHCPRAVPRPRWNCAATRLCLIGPAGPANHGPAEQDSGHCQHSHPRSALQVEECQPLNNGASGDCHSNLVDPLSEAEEPAQPVCRFRSE